MGKQKRYTDIDQFWREAPQKLKNQVKTDILSRGYNIDPTGGSLSAHLWESAQWDVSYECCAELIAHYAEVKRQASLRREGLADLATMRICTEIEKDMNSVWNRAQQPKTE